MATRDIYQQWERKVREGALAEGLLKGQSEGRSEGRMEATRAALLGVLDARGFAVNRNHRQRIEACAEHGQLDAWLRRAATATSASEVFEVLASQGRGKVGKRATKARRKRMA